tara:strand:+ start:320 stop:850 length:531 start_codon:yes stop_codon:yes gene_type:complete
MSKNIGLHLNNPFDMDTLMPKGDPHLARRLLKEKLFNNKNNLSKSVKLLKRMKSMHISEETNEYYENNAQTIYDNYEQAKLSCKEFNSSSSNSSSDSSSEGCYIATMAYGDYEHPQVLELRKFRDEILKQSFLGRIFIILYYKFSPFMVKKLKEKERINIKIKELLDKFIYKIIKK